MDEDKDTQIIQDENRLLTLAMGIYSEMIINNLRPLDLGGRKYASIQEIYEGLNWRRPELNILLEEITDTIRIMEESYPLFNVISENGIRNYQAAALYCRYSDRCTKLT